MMYGAVRKFCRDFNSPNIFYNIARVLALSKSYWAMRKQDEVRIFLQVLRSLSAQKRKHYFEQSKPLLTSGLWLFKQFLVTRVHLALIFYLFPVNFELSIHSYRLTGSDVLAQTKVSNVACFWPANRDVCFLFFGALWEFCTLSGTITRADPCCRSERICSCF